MKITLIHYAAPPVIGGVEAVMAQHARLMAEAGHQVCVVAGRGQQWDARIEFALLPEADSRHPQVLALKRELDAGRVPAALERFVEQLASELHKLTAEADCLIAHNVCSLNKNLALTAALYRLSKDGTRPHLILWHHDLAWTTPRYKAELHEGYPWELLKIDWPWAQQVVVSEQRREELARLLDVTEERIDVIPNGLDPAQFLKLEAETQCLVDDLRLLSADPLLLLPVRITPRKNIELALRVLAALRVDFPDARLVVTGPLGPHNPANTQYFERLLAIREELGLRGAAYFLAEVLDHSVPDPVIADLYRIADLLFLPSREEGFGIPILEAGLARIPIFAADIPVLRELGSDQIHYFSLDDAPAQVAGRIVETLHADRRYAMRKRVLKHYIWRKIYEERIAPLLAKG